MQKVITNKFAGKCVECNTAVPAGRGFARKTDTKWTVVCRRDNVETNGANSPWKALHLDAELDYTGGEYTPRKAMAAVDREYTGTDKLAEKCPNCPGTCHWRATVGARICPDCHTMIWFKWENGAVVMKVAQR